MQTCQIEYDQVKTNYFEVIAEKFETRYIELDGINNDNQSLRFRNSLSLFKSILGKKDI